MALPPPCLATAAKAPEVAAKMMVATDRGDCQRLKELVNKEDATTMVVVMSRKEAPAKKHTPASMHPLLAEAACTGNWEEINFLLEGEDLQEGHSSKSKTRSQKFLDKLAAYPSGPAATDVEEGINAVSLLKGVTVEGDTALHLVAANGEGNNFVKCADLIHGKDKGLLSRQNYKGDTPLHCAARAGKSQMVSHLIVLATGDNIVEDLVRQENNSNETVLHVAIRNGAHGLVQDLLAADPKLACFPQQGTSPLYLAILLEHETIAQTLYEKSENNVLSYSGPNGQNALHAAVLRGPEVTGKLLNWNKNKDLTTGRDANGSTPLHFAAGLPGAGKEGSACAQVFDATTSVLYQPDNDGLSPIHVAAAARAAEDPIAKFVSKCPSSAGLRDAKGRTFLHVAVEKKNERVVRYACNMDRSLAWVLNMQDNQGNTALHLAVKDASLAIFRPLFGNRQVNLNLTNEDGQTPLDIARYNIRPSFYDGTADPEVWTRAALEFAGARGGASRKDHFDENYEDRHGVKTNYVEKELEMLKDSTQFQSIGPVLVATVTFGAMFALPGGYRADDSDYGGTPTLAGTFAFHAFMVTNTLAFIFSTIATLASMYAGSARLNLVRRKAHFNYSIYFMHNSIMALAAAFALGVYTVLSPVAQKTATLICVMSPLVVLYNFKDFWLNWARFAMPLLARKGAIWTLRVCAQVVLVNMFSVSWLIIVFAWASYGRDHPISKAVSPAQAPPTFA
ncbi:hypothetical protein GQ55_2G224300 [Panicum hallii var. hallii]|uniref:PGG domain-containing protein n=1 Tax=Panicum hallii var. hallii TaxID=1504633 RepID=A0A2T7ERC0_9POAL|nr:hypothetical protein GQ55_2G224300 [Panicum hallii var. hallii]